MIALLFSLTCVLSFQSVLLAETASTSQRWPAEWKDFASYNICESSRLNNGLCKSSQHKDCSCEPDCTDYGDCCIDAVKNTTTLGRHGYVQPTWKCVDVGDDRNVYVKTSCPDDYPNFTIASQCKTYFLYEKSFHGAPVYDAKSGVFYANVYCASCNDVPWTWSLDLEVACPTSSTRQRDVEDVEYDIDQVKFILKEENNTMKDCVVNFIQDEIVNWKNLRNCSDDVSYCKLVNPDQEENEDWSLCPIYNHRVYSENGRAYKNFHCALCNGQDPKTLSCRQKNPQTQDQSAEENIQTFKLGLTPGGAPIHGYYCRLDQLYLKHFELCLDVVCPQGYRWLVRRCVRNVTKQETKADKWTDFFSGEYLSQKSGSMTCNPIDNSTLEKYSKPSAKDSPRPLGHCSVLSGFPPGSCSISVSCIDPANISRPLTKFDDQHTKNIAPPSICVDSFCSQIFLVDQCPPDWPNDRIRSLCEQSIDRDTSGFEKTVVYSKSRGFFYKNIYCARCHKDVNEFRVEISCPRNNFFESFENKLIFDPKTRTYSINDEGTIKNCTVETPTEDLLNVPRFENIKFCHPTRSNCLSGPKVADFISRCEYWNREAHVLIDRTFGSSEDLDCMMFQSNIVCYRFGLGVPFAKGSTVLLSFGKSSQDVGGNPCGKDKYFDEDLLVCVPKSR